MKEQGFTLVELLAVIVILAVLALIATPVVLSIIDDTKESAMLRSAEMYLSGVENAVMRENMNTGGNFRPTECTISSEGNLDCDGKDGIIEVEVNGEKPKNGSIVFENGKIKDVTLTYQSGTIVKDINGDLVYEDNIILEPGLYDDSGKMTYSWQELLDNEILFDTDFFGLYSSNGSNESADIAPKILKGKLVLNSENYLAFNAFMDCNELTHVIINEGVSEIGEWAFAYCTKLEIVDIPKSMTDIYGAAFAGCQNLKTINYNGTMEEWDNINLSKWWNQECLEITVHCTDGEITIPAWVED